MGRTNYGVSRITGKKEHFWNETHAECTKCKEVFEHSNFHSSKIKSRPTHRPISPTCKPCTADITFEARRKNIITHKYRSYKGIMRSEGNDCDLTEEEFRKLWPEGSKCPILGHKMRLYPKEERGIWKGGRHYPYTPTIDHVDPRMPMNKENMQIICWRANELKGDSIPEEIELLYRNLELRDDRYWKGSFMDIISSSETTRLKQKLSDNNWVGKYSDDRKL